MKFRKIILKHLKKAFLYRVVTMIVTFLFLWIVYKDVQKAIIGTIGVELVIHTSIYVAFEYFWNRKIRC